MEGQSGQTTMEELFGPPISVYTREQAFEDGQLIDVSQADVTRDAGFRVPVALTAGAWAWVKPEPMPSCQDFNGRLWDVYTMLNHAIRVMRNQGEGTFGRVPPFSVLFAGGPGLRGRQRRRVTMIARFTTEGPGGSTVLTIMLPEED